MYVLPFPHFCINEKIAYSGDGVYLFSALDEPDSRHETTRSSLVPPNVSAFPKTWSFSVIHIYPKAIAYDSIDGELSSDEGNPVEETTALPQIPVIFPRRGFTGARNVETIKDGMSLPHSSSSISLFIL